MPEGAYNQAALRYPWLFLSLCPSYLGLTGGILDTTAAYLRGELPGQPAGARRDHPIKQHGWAQMQLRHEQSRALLYRAIDDGSDSTRPRHELITGWAAAYTVMEHAAEVASMAIRVCGGQSMMKHLAAGAHVSRCAAGQHDAAVERRGVPRTVGSRPSLRRGSGMRTQPHERSGMTTVRPALSRAAIVDAALDLMTGSTSTSLTMRRLGDVLGVDPTAVYRHFRDKAELMRAVGDRLLSEVTLDVDRDEHWRSVVVTVCMRVREAMLRQPQLAASLRDAPALEAGEFAITETLLQQFLRAGLSPSASATAYHSVIELTVGSATIDVTLDALDDVERQRQYDRWRQAYASLPADQYPASRRVADQLYRGTASERFASRPRALARRHRSGGVIQPYWRACSSLLRRPARSPATTPPAPIPLVLDALVAANTGHALAYGADRWTAEAEARFRDLFGPPIEAFLVWNGTGANVMALATMVRPADSVVCSELGPHRRRRDRRARARRWAPS